MNFAIVLPKLLWILQILCALGIIILVHEWGHFFTAKRSGMKVHEFAVGGGPAVFRWERGGTVYSLRPYFPFMGFVRIAGLEGEEDAEEVAGSFHQQPLSRRMLVLSAGALMNIVLGVALFCFIYGVFGVVPERIGEVAYVAPGAVAPLQAGDRLVAVNGVREEPLDVLEKSLARTPRKPVRLTVQRQGREVTVTVTPKIREIAYRVTYPDRSQKIEKEPVADLGVYWKSGGTTCIEWVRPKSPAEQAGLQVGDQIVAINGERTPVPDRIQEVIEDHLDQPLSLTIQRRGQEWNLTVTPRMWQGSLQEIPAEERKDGTIVIKRPLFGQIGIAFQSVRERLPVGMAIVHGTLESVQWIVSIPVVLLKMVQRKAPPQVSGPVGVVREMWGAASLGLEYFLNLAALFSINIALFNLFPLPALDGGRLAVLVLEGIRRKPMNRRLEAMVHFVGLMALLALLIVISIGDIRTWIQGTGP